MDSLQLEIVIPSAAPNGVDGAAWLKPRLGDHESAYGAWAQQRERAASPWPSRGSQPRRPGEADPSPSGMTALPQRLYQLGLDPATSVTVTRNRTVMISWRPRGGLRLHAGYAAAPDDVLRAIVRFLARRVPRAERIAARRTFMAFPVDRHVASRPPRPRKVAPVSPADRPIVDRLMHCHELLNAKHFNGELATIPIRLSDRMRRRLGELRAPPSRDFSRGPMNRGPTSREPPEIIISRRHIRRDGWEAAIDTLLHEMVHQWQAEAGHPLDHGREFRRKAREVGIVPRAVADLRG